MRYLNIIYLCFLAILLLSGFHWLLMPDLFLSSSATVYQNYRSIFAIEHHSNAVLQVLLSICGLIYLKIIWRLINPPESYK